MSAIKLKNKIYIVLIAIVLIVIAIVAILLINNSTSRVVITNDKEEKVMNSNALTMMYETEAGSGEYQVTSDTTWPQDGYIFNERLSGCENGSTLTWDDERKAVILSTNVSDKCYVYFDVYAPIFSDYIINDIYTTDGENGLYYHDGQGDYVNADLEAGDNSYRFAGADPNNYVCFGSDEETCPADNLYRIVGVFNNQVKLIKAINYGNYAWDAVDEALDNTWNESTKPDIYTTLNETYYNTILTEWQNKIADATWQVGGMNTLGTAKEIYDVEVGTGQSGYEETMKVGLMYVTDYGYGVNPEKWSLALNASSSNYGTDNWLYIDSTEWLISRASNDTVGAFYIDFNAGCVFSLNVHVLVAVRPSFYLNSDVTYISGSGTESDPFRIA